MELEGFKISEVNQKEIALTLDEVMCERCKILIYRRLRKKAEDQIESIQS